jgi:hypothetical protein
MNFMNIYAKYKVGNMTKLNEVGICAECKKEKKLQVLHIGHDNKDELLCITCARRLQKEFEGDDVDDYF